MSLAALFRARPVAARPAGSKGLAMIVGPVAAAMLSVAVPKVEGTILRGYRDPVGIVTACTGHTKTAVLGRAYTREECARLLDEDLAQHATGVMACIHVPTTSGQRAAFVSFGFNAGVRGFCTSSMARLLNAGDAAGACDALRLWTKAKGRVLPGLVRRREIERDMCLQKESD